MDWGREGIALVWVAIAIGAGVIEMFTLDFIFLMVAGGALTAGLVAALSGSAVLSIIAFAVGTVALLVGARPPLKRYMQNRVPEIEMHTDALIGESAQTLTKVENTGQIRLGGELWSARIAEGEEPAPPGITVRVLRIDGATAVVSQQVEADGTPQS